MKPEAAYEDRAVCFNCDGSALYGILTVPKQTATRGIIVVVGGPQYRVGSHRQFTLLARNLAAHGIPVMRFDVRGMGDSEGEPRTFESITADLNSAVEALFNEIPCLREVVLWGLCDAASAIMFFAAQDARVTGIVLLNPWVRTTGGLAQATLKHYYSARLLDKSLWRKILSGNFGYATAVRSFLNTLNVAYRGKSVPLQLTSTEGPLPEEPNTIPLLPQRVFAGFVRFRGQVLFVFSGADLTAKEFRDLARGSPDWKAAMASPNVSQRVLPSADHTFSQREWRDQVALWTREWMATW